MNGEAGSREVMLGSLARAVLIPGGSEATSWGLELVKDFPSSRSQHLACEPFNPATTSKNDGGKPQPPHQRKAYPTSPTCAGAGGSFIKKKRRKKKPASSAFVQAPFRTKGAWRFSPPGVGTQWRPGGRLLGTAANFAEIQPLNYRWISLLGGAFFGSPARHLCSQTWGPDAPADVTDLLLISY